MARPPTRIPPLTREQRNTGLDAHDYALRTIIGRLDRLGATLTPETITWWGELVRYWPLVDPEEELAA